MHHRILVLIEISCLLNLIILLMLAQLVGSYQFVSRPNKSCLDIVSRKSFTFMISRYLHKNIITFDNDATSCSDQKIPLFAMMICQQFSLSKTTCDILIETLHNMRWYMKTGNSLLESFYSHMAQFTIFGIGQSNRAFAPIWLFTSVFFNKIIETITLGHGICLTRWINPQLMPIRWNHG